MNKDEIIKTQQEEIERLKQTELKTKGGGIKVTLEGLLDIEKKMLELEAEIEKKDKIIDEMAKYIEDESTVDEFCSKENCYADDYENGHCRKCLNCIKKYFINKAEKENKDDN